MAKTKISLSLIKDGIDVQRVVKDGVSCINLPGGNVLYYRPNVLNWPKWVDSFFDGQVPDEDVLKTKSVSALILYNVEVEEGRYRLFAICFGYGRNLLNQDVAERRFGLITVLNQVDEKLLRSVDTNSMGSAPRNNRMQTSMLSNMVGFNIDVDKDILKSVTGRAIEEGFISGTISGSDALSISTELKYDTIKDLLVSCYNAYCQTDYERKFPWIDKMTEVKDRNEINRLNDSVVASLNSENSDNVWISIPEIVDYGMDYFKIESDEHYQDVDVNVVTNEVGNGEFTIKKVKEDSYFMLRC